MTYKCARCGTTVKVDETVKEPRCPMCSSHALIDVDGEEMRTRSCSTRDSYG